MPWQHAYKGMKGVLVAWFCVPMTKIGKFHQIGDYACHDLMEKFRWLQRFALNN